ncbi:MAG: hypothetical protein JST32_07155 [Bacteroidetes bacterium]|nr:hypothetical protein [Bacteroidota bacterium]
MEVHHHPQLHHEKKPWKEYILEFLMIFLAVTMGFFAETIRESISDSSKGKEYIRSYVEDLRRDTGNYSIVLTFNENKLAALNKLSACYDALQKDNKATGCLVPLLVNAASNRSFGFADGTLQQLKNAGGFQLLKKVDKDSIIAFEFLVRGYMNFESTVFQERQNIIRGMVVKLISFKAAESIRNGATGNIPAPVLFSGDKAELNEFFNDLSIYRRVTVRQNEMLREFKTRSIMLIKYFDEKYHLE